MQSEFDGERNKHRRGYGGWKETETNGCSPPLSHHYSVLGLDRSRKTTYTDTEIKAAFRAKSMVIRIRATKKRRPNSRKC
ncbi:hypothetical protein MLD38_002023 [Melastoma candidum]|uniref:Uncharacterized protein n=1 Tax=Melastoma candidum TaxID=119954 RepID=A0ACB9SH45_9MYRT|nr:hypothetical protein MLD38_002023 [Melastoma candidum]